MTASSSREEKAAASEWNKAKKQFENDRYRYGFTKRGKAQWRARTNSIRSK